MPPILKLTHGSERELLNQLKSTIDRVENILRTKPATRDSDALLMACYYFRYFDWDGSLMFLNPINFLEKLFLFTPPETIRRNRQLLMKKNPELIGLSYKPQKARKVAQWVKETV